MFDAEVRFYYNGRQDWDTEYLSVNSAIELATRAKEMAKNGTNPAGQLVRATADFYNYSTATPLARPTDVRRRPRLSNNVEDQIAAIEGTVGKEDN